MEKKVDPEVIHDNILDMEDQIQPITNKVRDAINCYEKRVIDQDENSIERIEALEYFKNEIGPLVEWLDRYHKLNEEFRDIFLGNTIKQYIPKPDPVYEIKKNKLVASLEIEIRSLEMTLSQKELLLEEWIEDAHKYKMMINNISLIDWFKIRILRKFK